MRVAGFIVVSQSCSAFISPRPLKRWMVRFLAFISLTISVAFLLVLGVARDLAGADAEQRRLGDVEVAVLDELGHVAVEEGHQQRPDVRAVDVRVRQQDDLVVAQLGEVERLADAGAERDDQRPDLLADAAPCPGAPSRR